MLRFVLVATAALLLVASTTSGAVVGVDPDNATMQSRCTAACVLSKLPVTWFTNENRRRVGHTFDSGVESDNFGGFFAHKTLTEMGVIGDTAVTAIVNQESTSTGFIALRKCTSDCIDLAIVNTHASDLEEAPKPPGPTPTEIAVDQLLDEKIDRLKKFAIKDAKRQEFERKEKEEAKKAKKAAKKAKKAKKGGGKKGRESDDSDAPKKSNKKSKKPSLRSKKFPRFSTASSGSHAKALTELQGGGRRGPGFIYVWHFIDATGSFPAGHENLYRIGQTVLGRETFEHRTEWQQRIYEQINVPALPSGWKYVIDRVYFFKNDALLREAEIHARLMADGYPRKFRSHSLVGPAKYVKSASIEVRTHTDTRTHKERQHEQSASGCRCVCECIGCNVDDVFYAFSSFSLLHLCVSSRCSL